MGSFVKTAKDFKKLDEVDDADEIINTKKMHLNPGQRLFPQKNQKREIWGIDT